ncbi:MAG: RNA methyltransferase [Oscillospiraceae bacterium]|jgi:TrmH family RNA methyltransferase|nr:RNA methyltransferase [Oscillospiraceae bacterium]
MTARALVTSRDNPLVKQCLSLAATRKARREAGLFLCDGPSLLPEALAHGAAVTMVLCAEGRTLPPLPETVRTVELSERLIRAASPTETPQGLVFLCRLPDTRPPAPLPAGRYVLLDRVQDPGNVGSIVRTAAAFGFSALLLGPGCADPFSPKAVRAAMGATFRLPLWETDDPGAALGGCPVPVYAALPGDGARDVREIDLSACVLLLGNEGAGLSQPLIDRADGRIKLPMAPHCESLGVAAAAAALLWEAARKNGV